MEAHKGELFVKVVSSQAVLPVFAVHAFCASCAGARLECGSCAFDVFIALDAFIFLGFLVCNGSCEDTDCNACMSCMGGSVCTCALHTHIRMLCCFVKLSRLGFRQMEMIKRQNEHSCLF